MNLIIKLNKFICNYFFLHIMYINLYIHEFLLYKINNSMNKKRKIKNIF